MGVDFAALFDALPTAYLVMDVDLVIVEANPAFLRTTGRVRSDILGKPVFEALTADPADAGASDPVRIRASIERVLRTGTADTMDVLRYRIPVGEAFTERSWSLVHVPVLDSGGDVEYVVQRSADVTDDVRDREAGRVAAVQGEQWLERVLSVETDLSARAQELLSARDAQAHAAQRVGAVVEVALDIAGAGTVEELADRAVGGALRALGARGGALAVLDDSGEHLDLTFSEVLGPQAQREYARLPVSAQLPPCVAAATDSPVLLGDLAAAVRFSPETAQVAQATGTRAWVSLPLRAGGRVLGSLSLGWVDQQDLPAAEVEILWAFSAQCAQALDRILTRDAERATATAVRRLSETIQRSLLTEPLQPPGLQIAARYQPAAAEAQVGGDWYDAFVLADGATTVVIGDVAGHDRDAAASMAQVRNVLRGIAHAMAEPPARVLSGLDRALLDLGVDVLATAVLGRIEGDQLTWTNAGHPPPMLVHADGAVEVLTREPDLLLGLDPDTARTDHRAELRLGTTVLLYTDGLVERRGASLDDGTAWLAGVAARHALLPLEDFCDALLAEVDGDMEDDVALLALRSRAS